MRTAFDSGDGGFRVVCELALQRSENASVHGRGSPISHPGADATRGVVTGSAEMRVYWRAGGLVPFSD